MVGTETVGVDAASEPGRDVDVTFPGGGDVGGRRTQGGDLCCHLSEHCRKIYHNKYHCGTVSGGNSSPRSLGIKEVVVKGGTIYRGDTGGGSSGGVGN